MLLTRLPPDDLKRTTSGAFDVILYRLLFPVWGMVKMVWSW